MKIAIIGGGPAGLSTAIEFSKLPWIDWQLFEQKPAISEIGTGITLQQNTWRLLEHLGASNHIHSSDFFRPEDGHSNQFRHGRSGDLIKQSEVPSYVPPHQRPCRIHRAKLQQALLRQVDITRVHTGKKLLSAIELPSKRLRLDFTDGSTDEVDLLVGADGIRSAVRKLAFPDYKVKYTGATAYRATVNFSEADRIAGFPRSPIFWYGTQGKWAYTAPLNDELWEITCRIAESDDQNRSTWGQEVNPDVFRERFQEFCQPIQQLMGLVVDVKRYDYFAGDRLQSIVKGSSIALVGDASHPLSGAFGAGAAFALEDAHALAGSLAWSARTGRSTRQGLELFDQVRSPHYLSLYATLDDRAAHITRRTRQPLSPDEEIIGHIEAISEERHNWMYYHKVDCALSSAIKSSESKASL